MHSYTEEYKDIIIPIVLKYLPKVRIILYGSRARKDDRQGLDIDIALDIGKKIDNTIMNRIIEAIDESTLPIEFDIVDFHSLSERMQREVEKDGAIWQI